MEFGYTLWATVPNEAIQYSEKSDDFGTMAHNAGFGSALWAIAQDLVMCCGQ
jgi:hypothetical protein